MAENKKKQIELNTELYNEFLARNYPLTILQDRKKDDKKKIANKQNDNGMSKQ